MHMRQSLAVTLLRRDRVYWKQAPNPFSTNSSTLLYLMLGLSLLISSHPWITYFLSVYFTSFTPSTCHRGLFLISTKVMNARLLKPQPSLPFKASWKVLYHVMMYLNSDVLPALDGPKTKKMQLLSSSPSYFLTLFAILRSISLISFLSWIFCYW